MIYEIRKEKEMKIFNPIFVKNNQKKCRMIIENKILPLEDKYIIKDVYKKYLKLKLVLFIKNRLDFSYMFNNITSLKKFYAVSERDNISKTENDLNNYKDNNYYDKNTELNNQIKNVNLSFIECDGIKNLSFYKNISEKNFLNLSEIANIEKSNINDSDI